MSEKDRTWLLNARLANSSSLLDIGIEGGLVTEVRPAGSEAQQDSAMGRPTHRVDLAGRLLLPALCEHHAHLDKSKTADSVVNQTGDLAGAIEAWIEAERAGLFDIDEMEHRVESTVIGLIHSGVTRIRTHVNVGASDPDLRNLRAVQAVRSRLASLVDIEVVALLHSPLTGPEGHGNRQALERALEYGVDLVGGCPHLEPDPDAMIDFVLASAMSARVGVDLHVDETLDPQMLTLLTLARKIVQVAFDLEVSASHCVSLSVQPVETVRSIAREIARARIRVIALPQTNLFLQGWSQPVATPRGIAPIAMLSDLGVDVAAGGDNIEDPFNPMGRSDPLETAALLVMAGHVPLERAFESVAVRSLSQSEPPESLVGSPGDFLGIAAANVREAVARAPAERITIRRGRVVARTNVQQELDPSST